MIPVPNYPYRFKWKSFHSFNPEGLKVSMFSVKQPKKYEENCYFTQQKCLILELTLVRKINPSIISIFIPSMIIVYMAFVSFWIDPLAVPGRVTLIVTSLLALITQLLSLRKESAPVSYLTALDVWFFTCLTLVSGSLFEFAIAYTDALKKKTKQHVSNMLGNMNSCQEMLARKKSIKNKIASVFRPKSIDSFSRYFFPYSFLAFKFIYFISYCLIAT